MHPTCALREQLYLYGEDEVAGEVRGAPEAPLQPDHTTLQPCSPAALQPCSPVALQPCSPAARTSSTLHPSHAPLLCNDQLVRTSEFFCERHAPREPAALDRSAGALRRPHA